MRELDEEILVLLGEAAVAVGEDLDQAQVPPVAPGERRRQDVVGLQRAVPVPIRGETRAVRVDEPGGAPGPVHLVRRQGRRHVDVLRVRDRGGGRDRAVRAPLVHARHRQGPLRAEDLARARDEHGQHLVERERGVDGERGGGQPVELGRALPHEFRGLPVDLISTYQARTVPSGAWART